jgi:hypothetical protein
MIRTPPEHNIKNPPGQIVDKLPIQTPESRPGFRRGLYLRDVIKRIQGEEEPMKLPTPIAGPAKRLADLVGALERACGEVEADDKKMQPHYGPAPSIRTALIRRLIKENT